MSTTTTVITKSNYLIEIKDIRRKIGILDRTIADVLARANELKEELKALQTLCPHSNKKEDGTGSHFCPDCGMDPVV